MATVNSVPTSDILIEWTTPPTGTHFDDIDEGPGGPGIDNIITSITTGGSSGDIDKFGMSNADIEGLICTSIKVYTNGDIFLEVAGPATCDVIVTIGGASVMDEDVGLTTTQGWHINTLSNLNWTQDDIDNLTVAYRANLTDSKDWNRVYTCYVEITYETKGDIIPDGTLSEEWSSTPVQANHLCIDEGRTPITSDLISGTEVGGYHGDVDDYHMSSLTIDEATEIVVYIYGAGNPDYGGGVEVDFSPDGTNWEGYQGMDFGQTPAHWLSKTFSGLSMTQANLDLCRIRLRCLLPQSKMTIQVYTMYALVSYTTLETYIAKINDVAIANIAKINDVAIANIKKWNNVE